MDAVLEPTRQAVLDTKILTTEKEADGLLDGLLLARTHS